jgi:hypothetical protein
MFHHLVYTVSGKESSIFITVAMAVDVIVKASLSVLSYVPHD